MTDSSSAGSAPVGARRCDYPDGTLCVRPVGYSCPSCAPVGARAPSDGMLVSLAQQITAAYAPGEFGLTNRLVLVFEAIRHDASVGARAPIEPLIEQARKRAARLRTLADDPYAGGTERDDAELLDGLVEAVLRSSGPAQKDDGIYYDEETKSWVAKHTVMTAGRTEAEAALALASAIKLTAAHWPPRGPAQKDRAPEPLRAALLEICLRLEKPMSDDTETHRELSAERARRLEAVYAIAEAALAGPAQKDAPEPAVGQREPWCPLCLSALQYTGWVGSESNSSWSCVACGYGIQIRPYEPSEARKVMVTSRSEPSRKTDEAESDKS